MLNPQSSQDFILNDKTFDCKKGLIRYLEGLITVTKNIEQYGEYSHALANLKGAATNANTIIHLTHNNKELRIMSHNLTLKCNAIHSGLYNGPTKTQALKEIGITSKQILDMI